MRNGRNVGGRFEGRLKKKQRVTPRGGNSRWRKGWKKERTGREAREVEGNNKGKNNEKETKRERKEKKAMNPTPI